MNTTVAVRRRILACALALAALVAISSFAIVSRAGQARFRQPNQEYQARRAKLRATIDAPVVIFGYTGHEDTSEVAVFYQETYFYYLTGHDEPGAALVILPAAPRCPRPSVRRRGPREILYLPPRNLEQGKMGGPKLGPNDPGIAEKTGFQSVEPFAKLNADLASLAKTTRTFTRFIARAGRRRLSAPHQDNDGPARCRAPRRAARYHCPCSTRCAR